MIYLGDQIGSLGGHQSNSTWVLAFYATGQSLQVNPYGLP